MGFEAFGRVEVALAESAGTDEFLLDVIEVPHRIEDWLRDDSSDSLDSSELGIGVVTDGASGWWEKGAVCCGRRALDVGVVAVGCMCDGGSCGVVGDAGDVTLRRVGFLCARREECSGSCAICFPYAWLLLCLRDGSTSDFRLVEINQITILYGSFLGNIFSLGCWPGWLRLWW
jgi:hypothetical protein